MTHEQAITYALALFVENYRDKFPVGDATKFVWCDMLSDLTADEVVQAARNWVARSKWPPTTADLRETLPRFCRCGKCNHCHHRAVERAKAACERGSMGADLDAPVHIGQALPPAVSPKPRLLR